MQARKTKRKRHQENVRKLYRKGIYSYAEIGERLNPPKSKQAVHQLLKRMGEV